MAHHLLMSETAHVEVDLDGQRHLFSWPRTQTLVDMLPDAGVDVPLVPGRSLRFVRGHRRPR
jgi:hypothetical protein